MKKIFLTILLLCYFAIGQETILSDDFSRPFLPDTTGAVAVYPLDSLFLNELGELVSYDYTGNGHTLTASGFTIGQQLDVQNSPLTSNGNCQDMDGSDDYLQNTSGDFDLGVGSFTLMGWHKSATGETSWGQLMSKYGTGGWQFRVSTSPSSIRGIYAKLWDQTDIFEIFGALEYSFDQWHHFAISVDERTSASIYVDGVLLSPTTVGTLADIGSITTTANYQIGQVLNVQRIDGGIAGLKVIKSALTIKQIHEDMHLASGWASNSGGVTRADSSETFKFHQGIVADTVYYNTVMAVGNWNTTVNVDGVSGGENLEVLTSADASTWITLGTITATVTASDYTIIGVGTGYIGFGLASGTVYIDNVGVSITGDFSLSNLRKDRRLRRLSN